MTKVSATTFYEQGLSYCGRCRSQGSAGDEDSKKVSKINIRRFKSHFGTTPGSCAYIWQEIEKHDENLKYFHLLWALLFLKLYDSEEVLSGMVGGVDEKTFRKYIWIILKSFKTLKKKVVSQLFISSLTTCSL